MGKPGFIFATLLPSEPFARNELQCLSRMLKEWDAVTDKYSSLKVIIGSAHEGALKSAEKKLKGMDVEYLHCPFKWDDRMSELRAHEIGFCKRFIHQHIMDMCYSHYLYWVDSDMYISMQDVSRWCLKLTHSSFFVTLPYCVRHGLAAPPEQFGAYVINTAALTPTTLAKMYQTRLIDNTICRIGAPDCEFKRALLATGGKEYRADDIYSEHFSEVPKPNTPAADEAGEKRYVYIYNKGTCFKKDW